jgi:hypothetical protein
MVDKRVQFDEETWAAIVAVGAGVSLLGKSRQSDP